MTVRSPPRKSFASRNLNSATRKPEQARPQRAYGGGGRLLVLGKRPEPTAASKTNTVAAPVPMNTPSLRRESGGQDVSVKLVPSGGGGWAQEKQPEPEPEPRRLAPPANKEPPVAPWAKQAVVDAAKPPEERAPAWSQKPAPVVEEPAPPPPPPVKPESPPQQQHQWRRSQDAERRMEQSTQPPPPPPQTSPKSEPPDKLQGESQSDYMKRLAQLRAAKRRAEEQAEDDARRARAAERLARLDAQRRAAHPPARPPPVQQQPEDDRWQRGARVPAPPVEREPLRDAGVPIERAATRDGRSFASMFSPPSEPNPDQLKVGDGYDRHPNREKPKLFDPKSGSYVDPSSRPPPAPKTRGRGLRVIDDAAAPKKEAPQVRLLARPADAKPAPGTIVQKKEEKKKLAELPKDLSNADAETVKRLKAERAAEKAARQPRTRGFLYKHENGDVVLADGQPSRRSKRGRGGRKRAEAAAAAAAKAEQERLAPGPPVRSSSAGSVGDRGRAPGPVSQQSPPEPARGLGVFSQSDAAPGNLSYAPFGGFSTAPPPPERAAVSALGGAEFIPRTSSAGSFGGIGIVQDDAPPRHDGPSTLGGAEFVPGAGLVRPEAASEQQLSSSFDAAGAPEFVPGGAFGSGLLGAPQKPGQPQGSGLLWDR